MYLAGRAIGAVLLLHALLASCGRGPAFAADKTGISPQTISLPSGPGSIEGLGESFEPQLNTGTATYALKVALPPGRNGQAPQIGLRYNGGAGNGILGMGWSLSGLDYVQRQTDKGLPHYDGRGDTFITAGGEELVPLSDGTFRAENEGGFGRYHFNSGVNSWTCDLPNGTLLTFGAAPDSRIEQTATCNVVCPNTGAACTNDGACQRTFRWYLSESRDRNGNIIRYHYRSFATLPAPFFTTDRMVYLSRIDYALHAAEALAGRHAVVFTHEARPDPVLDYRPGFELITAFRLRRIDICSAGVSSPGQAAISGPVTTCTVEEAGVVGATRIRAYTLTYEDDERSGACAGDFVCTRGLIGALCTQPLDCFPGASRLVEVAVLGSDNVGYESRAPAARAQALPPARFRYSDVPLAALVSGDPWGSAQPFPADVLGDPDGALIDLNSDGLADAARLDGGSPEWWENIGVGADGTVRFAQRGFFSGPSARLSASGTQFVDLDGNGTGDLLTAQGAGGDQFFVYGGTGDARFDLVPRPFEVFNYSGFLGPEGFESPEVRFVDLDFDKRIDVVRSVSDGSGGAESIEVLLNRSDRLERQLPCSAPQAAYFPTGNVFLVDMTGDRLLDVVIMVDRPDEVLVRYLPAVGRGGFGRDGTCGSVGGEFVLAGGPSGEMYRSNPSGFRWQDVTNDGVADLVYVDSSRVRVWLNIGGIRLMQLPDFPPPKGFSFDRFDLLDVNGNGTTDIVLAERGAIGSARYLDLIAPLNVPPNLLTYITNGIGRVTEIEYTSSTHEHCRDRDAGRAWRTRIPFPVNVVKRRVVSFGLDLDGVPGEDRYVTDFRYHDGYYDGREKEFRGFGEVEVIEHGDASQPNLVTRHRFHTGAPDGVNNDGDGATDEFTANGGAEEESLKGRPLEVRRETCSGTCSSTGGACDDDGDCASGQTCECGGVGEVFDHAFSRWEIRRLYAPKVCSGDPSVGCCASSDCAAQSVGTCGAEDSAHPGRQAQTTCVAGKGVQFALQTGSRTAVIERGAGPRKDLFTGSDYDDFGNQISERNWGVVQAADLPPFGCILAPGACSTDPTRPCSRDSDCIVGACERRSLTDGNAPCSGNPFAFTNPAEPDDERFTQTELAHNATDWLVSYECRSETQGCSGCTSESSVGSASIEARSQQSYDGLALCQVSKGNPTLSEEWLDTENRWLPRARNSFDAFGNVIEVRDARDNRRTLAYDDAFKTYPTVERVHLDGYTNAPRPHGQAGTFSAPAYSLNMTGEYHEGFGVVTRSTSWGREGDSPTGLPAAQARGPATSYSYDAFGRLTATVSPGDTNGAPTSAYEYRLANPDAADVLGRSLSSVVARKRETAGGGTVDSYAYVDGLGHKLGMKEEGDSPSEWIFSAPSGFNLRGAERFSWLPYATSGPEYEPADPAQARAVKLYDAAGRAVQTNSPPTGAPNEPAEGAHVQMVYRPLATDTHDENDTANVTPNAFVTHENDGLDRLIHVVERNHQRCASGHCGELDTRYAYDARGNLIRIIDAQLNQKSIQYDSLSRKTLMNDPNGGHLAWMYDHTDNVIRSEDAKGQVNLFSYDRANRLRSENYLDNKALTPDVTYVYDFGAGGLDMGDGSTDSARHAEGYVASVYDLSGEEHTSYDERRRVEWEVKSIRDPLSPSAVTPYATRMAFDSMDRVTSLTYPDGDQLEYGYGRRGLVNRARGPDQLGRMIVADVQYRPSGQLASIEYGNDVVTTYAYDARQRLTDLSTQGARATAGQSLIDYAYTFDPVSNINAIVDQRPAEQIALDQPQRNTQQFDYDDLHRLTGYVLPEGPQPGASITYRYDKIGNMLSAVSDIAHQDERTGLSLTNLGTMTYGGASGSTGRVGRNANDPPGPHALTRTDNGSEQRTYPYDANGNMTDIDGLQAQWDHKDRLVQVQRQGMTADYTYDYTDRRMTKRVDQSPNPVTPNPLTPSAVTHYINRYFEVRDPRQPTKYVWMGPTRVAQLEGTLDPSVQRVQRVHLDAGWNIFTLAVTPTAGNPLALGVPGSPIAEAYRWHAAGAVEYEPLDATNALHPADILWVRATSTLELPVAGAYPPVGEVQILDLRQNGAYVPNPWLESLPLSAFLQQALLWSFDPTLKSGQGAWRVRPPTHITQIPVTLGTLLAPGSVIYHTNPPAEFVVLPPQQWARVRFYHQDHLGSTNVETNGEGHVVEEAVYYPYGEPRVRRDGGAFAIPSTNYLFAQKERDEESGLQYFEARALTNILARFLSVDPYALDVPKTPLADPQRLHPYGYSRNGPLRFVDPSGKEAQPEALTDQAIKALRPAGMTQRPASLDMTLGKEFGRSDVAAVEFRGAKTFMVSGGLNPQEAFELKVSQAIREGKVSCYIDSARTRAEAVEYVMEQEREGATVPKIEKYTITQQLTDMKLEAARAKQEREIQERLMPSLGKRIGVEIKPDEAPGKVLDAYRDAALKRREMERIGLKATQNWQQFNQRPAITAPARGR